MGTCPWSTCANLQADASPCHSDCLGGVMCDDSSSRSAYSDCLHVHRRPTSKLCNTNFRPVPEPPRHPNSCDGRPTDRTLTEADRTLRSQPLLSTGPVRWREMTRHGISRRPNGRPALAHPGAYLLDPRARHAQPLEVPRALDELLHAFLIGAHQLHQIRALVNGVGEVLAQPPLDGRSTHLMREAIRPN